MSTKNNDRTPADTMPENKPEDENITPAETAEATAEGKKPSPDAEVKNPPGRRTGSRPRTRN
jgi:hypothetical protein